MKTHKLVNAFAVAGLFLSSQATGGFASPQSAGIEASIGNRLRAFDSDPARLSLVEAAQAEGALTVIALPEDWCNYGAILEGFSRTYGITVNSFWPEASSGDELQAIRDGIGNPTENTPDVIDVGPGFAVQAKTEGLITPYKVSTWRQIPTVMKDRQGYWYGDYYGLMAIAANTEFSAAPSSWDDLRSNEAVAAVALGGDPRTSNMAMFSVYAAALANGGSAADIEPGLWFFRDLYTSGRLNPVIGSGDSLLSGESPVLLEWSYLAQAQAEANPYESLTFAVPGPAIAGFYAQAISAYAPHPNAARLWMEYLYSDEGQLAFAAGHCIPVRYNNLRARGLIPEGQLPDSSGATIPTVQQTAAAQQFVEENWTCAVYGYGCPPNQPTTTAECKRGGWRNYPHAGFRNQGDCVSFVSSGRFVCRDPFSCVSYAEQDSIRLAAALWLSDEGGLGLDSQRGAELAVARQGELFGHGFDLRAEDDACSEGGGEAAAYALIGDPSIAAVVGTTCSSAARTASPILSAAGYSLVSPSSTSPALTDPATHEEGFLRTAWNDKDNAVAVAEHLVGQGKQTAFVLVQAETFYSVTVGEAFGDAFQHAGGNLVGISEVAPDDPALGDLLDALIDAGAPDVLFFPVFEPLGSQIVRAVRDRAGLDGTVMASNDAFYSQDFLNANRRDVVGMIFGLPDNSFTQSSSYAEFRDQYVASYGGAEPLEFFSAHAYDAATMILRAIERTAIVDGRNTLHIGRQALRTALFATDELEGLTGPITCDEFGDCSATGFVIIEIGPPEIGMVYFGDIASAWNASAYDGLQRAASDFGLISNRYGSSGDHAAALQQCADDGNSICFVAAGWLMPDEIQTVAQSNPEVFFVSLDLAWEDYPENLRAVLFRSEEGAYLAGALAGLMTDSDVVGAIGGIPIPPVEDFINGYRNGAQCYNPDVEVLTQYADTFEDPQLGRQLAAEMIGQGADVIFAPAGGTGDGSVLEATESGVWAIGVDTDAYLWLFDNGSVEGSGWLLTSALKRLDNVIYLTVQDWVGDALGPGTVSYGLAEGGVGLADYHDASSAIPDEVKSTIEAIEAGILDGSIDVSDDCAPPAMGLRVNYGHDWVESFYEAGHNVVITVTDGDGAEKATATVHTAPRADWGGEPGFNSMDTPEAWSPSPPDLQPHDWVYAQVDNGVSAQVQLGVIEGVVEPWADRITGTVAASWIPEPVPVECLDWGSGGGPHNKDGGTIAADGTDPYACQWDPDSEWDVLPGQDIGVGYSGPDGHWVANAFRAILIRPSGSSGSEFWVGPSDSILLRWGWGACTPELVDDFLGALSESYVLDGEPLTAQWTDPVEDPGMAGYCGGESGWLTYWQVLLGVMPAGDHLIETSVSLTRAVTDGIDLNGDGQPDFYEGSLFGASIIVHAQ